MRGWLVAAALAATTACGARPPDVFLVSVDTLRADHLGAHGSTLGLTPRLDELAAGSLVFERAYAPSSYTLPSVAALLTGRLPEEVGVDYNTHRLREDVPHLAAKLRAGGWRTGAVVSNYVLGPQSGVDRGFERFDAELTGAERNRGLPDRSAEATTDAALALLDALLAEPRRPVLLWVHYQDPHGPYTPPERFWAERLRAEREAPGGRRPLRVSRDRSGRGGIPPYQVLRGEPREVATYRARYQGEVAYVDSEIGRLLDALRERGLFDDAIVVFGADHGESLGEDDLWFAHGELLTEPLVRVPLWLRIPGRAPARRRDVASLLDVAPTLLAALGQPLPEARGRDLLAPGAERADPVLYLALPGLGHAREPRQALIADGHKYVMGEGQGAPLERLVRLGTDAPDLAADDPVRTDRMRRTLENIRAGLPPSAHARELSAEEERALEALGYGTREDR